MLFLLIFPLEKAHKNDNQNKCDSIKPCVTGVPCSGQYINWFGFITIPFLALIAFILIIIFMCFLKGKDE